jgi:putative transposase
MTTSISPELLDQLLAGYEKPEDLTGANGLFKQLKKALIERALGAELTDHLGYEKGDPSGRGSGNSRNGIRAKTVLTEDGELDIEVPRDRAGSFELHPHPTLRQGNEPSTTTAGQKLWLLRYLLVAR